ncbi:IclR family transcriptional regulator C-terminal domain-containing protein [Streptomyces sp. NPDC056400]|uniref:IclR family transcriptional regulator domain-containing protein n=1 Tax=Streptomyces sp. NPDC056400 TaxID=3345808 RepID=UPI0035E10076
MHISRLSDGPEAPRVYERVDFRFAGHASAIGTSLLQQLPFEARMDHLARRHPVRLTPRTIADQAGLFRSIAHGGPRSVQFDWQEHSPREVCVAVPLGFGQAEALALSLPDSQRHRRTIPPPHNATASRKPPIPPPDQTPQPSPPPSCSASSSAATRPSNPLRPGTGRSRSSHHRRTAPHTAGRHHGADRTGTQPARSRTATCVPDPVAGALLDIRALLNPLFTTQIVKGCLPG